MMARCFTVLAGCCLMLCGSAHAGWHAVVNTLPDSGVDIEVSSPIDGPPMIGYMPCWVTIKNRSGAAHTWTITSNIGGFGVSLGDTYSSNETLRVENDSSSRIALLVPVSPVNHTGVTYRQGSIRVEGYGTQDRIANIPSAFSSGKTLTPFFIGMGEALATPLWEPLKKEYASTSTDLLGSPVDVDLLGPDWRGLAGFDCLWFTEAEYASLDPERRLAIRNWIDRGGIFYLCTQTLDPALRAGLGLAEGENEAHPGFGSVFLIPWNGKTFSQADARARMDAINPVLGNELANDSDAWSMTKSVGTIPLSAPFLIAFIVIFAILVGPVNLFWLADSSRRHRLFWTTPLISIGASLLLVAVILLQDGFGGSGERSMLTLLLPEEKKAFVMQEQVSRTGVLFSRQFFALEDILFLPQGERSFTSGREYEQSGRTYSGDWFASRRVQAERAEEIVPSRAEIELLNPDAAKAGAAPVLVSTIPATLTYIRYIDPAGTQWRGSGLHVGAQATLQRMPSVERAPSLGGSAMLDRLQERVDGRRGYFVAGSQDGSFIETLRSVRWKKQEAVYVGPVTDAR